MTIRHIPVTGLLAVGLALPGSGLAASIFTANAAWLIQDELTTEVAGSYSINFSGSAGLVLPRFDSTLGTLQDVQIYFQSSHALYLDAIATDTIPEVDFSVLPPFTSNDRNDTFVNMTLTGTLRIDLVDPASSSRTLNLQPLSRQCSESVSLFMNASCSIIGSALGSYDRPIVVSGIDLMAFVGDDPINVAVSLLGSAFGNCDANDPGDTCVVRSAGMYWHGLAQVTYTYEAAVVPLPPASLLLASGLVLLSRRALKARHTADRRMRLTR